MKLKLLILLAVVYTSCSTVKKDKQDNGGKTISSFAEFESAMPAVRMGDTPIIKHGGFAGADGQVMEPCILQNPKDSTRLIMFYAGQNLIKTDGGRGALAKAWAYKSTPTVWHEDEGNPILTPDTTIAFESFSTRMDYVLYKPETDEYWIYYTGRDMSTGKDRDAIGLAICPAGKDGYSAVTKAKIKKYSGNPILSPTGQGRNDGTHVSQASILIDKGIYYMYYSYRLGDTLVLPGIRYATSTDGKVWTKQGTANLLSRGAEGAPDSKYFEWKQAFKAFNKYIIIWEAFDGKVWSICMASADNPAGPFTKSSKNPIFSPSNIKGAYDELYVATPAFYLINDKWYLYYTGANNGGDYNFNTWDMGAAVLK